MTQFPGIQIADFTVWAARDTIHSTGKWRWNTSVTFACWRSKHPYPDSSSRVTHEGRQSSDHLVRRILQCFTVFIGLAVHAQIGFSTAASQMPVSGLQTPSGQPGYMLRAHQLRILQWSYCTSPRFRSRRVFRTPFKGDTGLAFIVALLEQQSLANRQASPRSACTGFCRNAPVGDAKLIFFAIICRRAFHSGTQELSCFILDADICGGTVRRGFTGQRSTGSTDAGIRRIRSPDWRHEVTLHCPHYNRCPGQSDSQ